MSSAMLHALETVVAEPATDDAALSGSEAARYAVLRRIGSAIRHQIAGALQPVSMIASLVERRAQAPSPNLEALRRNCTEMSALSRSASAECVALMAWVAPHEGEQIPLEEGVAECLHLLTTELAFRGFAVHNACQGVGVPVARQSLRVLLPACLMALTDACATQAQVRISARADGDVVRLALALEPAADATAMAQRAKAYRALRWSDVHALAQAEGVVVQVGSQAVEIVLNVLATPPDSGAELRWG